MGKIETDSVSFNERKMYVNGRIEVFFSGLYRSGGKKIDDNNRNKLYRKIRLFRYIQEGTEIPKKE